MFITPICYIDKFHNNNIYIKREDLIPYSFGGNKARKGLLFFEDIDAGDYSCVVTYGSSHSNHCRVVANLAAQRNMPCYIIGPQAVSDETYNSKLMRILRAEIENVPVEAVHDAIERKVEMLRQAGEKPYFIPGGGHGNIGTQAYLNCYDEIRNYEEAEDVHFDYIFLASGTGTTQAGLVCGQYMNKDNRKIVGISIARKNPRGRDVVLDSIKEYLSDSSGGFDSKLVEQLTEFVDDYTGAGYGKQSDGISECIENMYIQHGIPMDSTYTAKAYYGMSQYITEKEISDKNILFIHTGGTPLFFDEI